MMTKTKEPLCFIKKHKYLIFSLLAFVLAFSFFLFAYPYHLVRREQQNLFLYDLAYILRTYQGPGFVSRFLGDFLEQFFCFKILGALLVSTLLTLIAVIVYKIFRSFAGKGFSFTVALIIYAWSFSRETGNIFITQYTIAVAGYLLFIYAALRFKGTVLKISSLIVFVALGIWFFGNPYHKYYGKLVGKPEFENEKLIAMDVETFRENWDKVLDLADDGLLYNEACYFQNLASAMKGQLPDKLLSRPQNQSNGLFLFVNEVTPFSNGAAGELWYHLGNMTLADQSSMVAMQSSPKHTGARFIQRLAMINLISEEYGAAEKYLKILDKTLVYHGWARSMMPGRQNDGTIEKLNDYRSRLIKKDRVAPGNHYYLLLKDLLEANPNNLLARDYLLCFELLSFDLETFMRDFDPSEDKSHLYQEAALVWLNIQYGLGKITDVNFDDYGISEETVGRLGRFYKYPENYKDTYWYYFTYARD